MMTSSPYQGAPSPRQVVGVVRDVRYRGPRSDPAPEIFIPHAQNPYLVMNVVVRTWIDPGALAQTARAQVLKVDPDQPVHSITTMEQLLDDTLQQDRFAMLFVALFAAAGLVTARPACTRCWRIQWLSGDAKSRYAWLSGRHRLQWHGQS
jgi:hypothetical protein